MKSVRALVRFLLLIPLLLAAWGHAAGPAEAAGARREAGGKLLGRVAPRAAAAHLQFQLDGARVRPRVERGRFVLEGVPLGAHRFSVVDMARNAGAHLQVRVRARGTTRLGTLTLEPGGQIAGLVSRVVDPESGGVEPLAGVEVVAEPEGGTEPPDGGGGIVPQGTAPGSLVAITDENGAYRFLGVPPGSYRVSVVAPGLEAGVEFVWVEVGRTAVADFLLRAAIEEGVGTVNGTVADASGAPVEGALVTLYAEEIYHPTAVSAASARRAARSGRARRARPESLPRGAFMTLTDYLGRYTLNVPSGYLWMEVYADGYSPVSQPLTLHPRETLTIDVTLEPYTEPTPGSLEGTVTDAGTGAPLEGAHVSVLIYRDHPHPGILMHPAILFTAVTDAGGAYRIEGLPAGLWQVEAVHDGYQTQVLEVEIHEGETARLEVALAPE